MSNVLPKEWNINQIGNILDISTGDKDTQNRIEDGKYPFFVRSNTIERLDSYSFDGEAVLQQVMVSVLEKFFIIIMENLHFTKEFMQFMDLTRK